MSPPRRVLALLVLVAALLPGAALGEEEPPASPDAPVPTPEPAPPGPDAGPVPGDEGPTVPPQGAARQTWREAMWRAPTAADWAKPVLLTFQRTWEDAVAVSKETGKPILICINMDGEIASEHYAGVRYRQPEIAALYEPYVCVIASVYRHNPTDYDEEGRRVLCPRFGSVTCGEHIAIEPVIYEKYCDGRRIAPRHIAVNLDHEEVYDVYYANDTASVFRAIRDGIAGLPPPLPPVVRGDRPITERVASRHVEDREAVEAAYRQGDAELRRRLLEAASKHPDAAPLDLLRLAIFGLDVDLARQGREALAHVDTPRATELVSAALRGPMSSEDRDALRASLRRLGESSPLARWLAGVHQGLATRSSAIDVGAWAEGVGSTYPAPPDTGGLVWRAEEQARAAEARPEDPEPRLQLAQASLVLAGEAPRAYPNDPRLASRLAEASYQEAMRAAREAEALGARGWRVDMVLAIAAYYANERDEAYVRAEAAMKDLPPGDASWQSMALVTIFAEARWQAIKAAIREKKEWPAVWLADLHAAYAVLLRHPLGTDEQVVWHYGFLDWLGADHRARRVLEEGLARFPHSEALHERLVQRLLEKRTAEAVEQAYDALLEKHDSSASLLSFAGRAALTVAEHHRRQRGWASAMAAYGRALARYEQAAQADDAWREASDQAAALALAGRARVAYQLGEDERALEDLLASFARAPEMAGTRDGMGITPGETAQMLLPRLRASDEPARAARLEDALASIDPALLLPDRE